MSATETEQSQPSLLDRALRVVTDVQAGEGLVALVLAFDVFVILTAYSIIKPVREGLILALASGAEYKAYMSGAIAIALLFAVPAYARLADRFAKNRLVVGVTLWFASNLLLFYLGTALPAVEKNLGLVFYLWIGVFNMMVVAQFWAFANDLYSESQGKRLFPLVGLGQTLGAVAGSGLSVVLIRALGTYPLLLVSGALLVLSAGLTALAHGLIKARPAAGHIGSEAGDAGEPAPDRHGAFALVRRHRYLTLIAVFSVVFTIVNSNGEFMLGKLFKAAAVAAVEEGKLTESGVKDYLGASYGEFYFAVNTLTLLVQGLVVSRVVKKWGVGTAFMVFPFVALGDALAVALLPLLAVLRVGKTVENATDYSLNNTLRNMLWLPTTTEMKYKAKQAIDTFFVRMGDVGSALLVWIGAGLLGLGVRAFAVANVVLVLIWLFVARAIKHEHAKLSGKAGA